MSLDPIDLAGNGRNGPGRRGYASGNASPRPASLARSGSLSMRNGAPRESEQDLLGAGLDEDDSDSGSDLPPPARRDPRITPPTLNVDRDDPYPTSGSQDPGHHLPQFTASGALNAIMNSTTEQSAAWFKRVDEEIIKPKLLLDGGRGPPHGGNGSGAV